MTKSKDSSIQIAAIVVGLLVVVGGAWLFLNSRDVADMDVTKQASTNSTKHSRDSSYSVNDDMSIDTSLQLAEMAFQSGELTGEGEGSALYFYRQVLAQDPENARAKAGLDLIYTQLVDEANDMLKKRNFSGVVDRISFLNKISPASDEVMALEAALMEEGDVLLASLDAAIEGNSFDQAERLIQNARNLPMVDSARLNSTVVQLATKRKEFEELQQAAQAQAELEAIEAAQAQAAQAAAAAASEAERVRLEEERENSLEAQLAKAKIRIDENQLFGPGDSAVNLYKQILENDADNSEAKLGLRGLVQKMTSKAYAAAEVGNWQLAEAALADAENAGIAENLIVQAREEIANQRIEIESNKVVSIDQFQIEKTVAPVYPTRAATRSIEGWVRVEFTISDTGETTNLQVVESSERLAKSFQKSATKAIEQWQFKPRMVGGKAISQRSQTTVQFRLDN